MIQGIFAEELISQHLATVQPYLYDLGKGADTHMGAQICWVPVKLQVSIAIPTLQARYSTPVWLQQRYLQARYSTSV